MFARYLAGAVAPALLFALTATAGASVPIDSGTLSGVRDLGRAPSSLTVRVAVVLNYHNDAELDRLVEMQADPDSPLYHQFLDIKQFRDAFAPTAAEYARVAGSLQRGGFTIVHEFANHTVVDATAPAPVAARYFETDIHRVLGPRGLTYTNVRAGRVPSDIADLVLAVVGLDAVGGPRPAYEFGARGLHDPSRDGAQRNGNPVFGPDGGYGPQVYINSYDLPAANGETGQGRASGVATDSDFLDSDLSGYLQYFNINRTGPATTRVSVDGGYGINGDTIETTLDVETIVSLAPGTALYVYIVTYDEPTNANFIDIYNQVVTDNLVDTLNSSYIYCETAINLYVHGYTRAVDHVEKQGAALGITFHAATGDSGSVSPGCYSSGPSVGEPSSTVHNMAIGGTTMQVNSQGDETSEVAWSGTGGGVSVIFKRPGYQKKVPNTIASGRNLPDLADDADPGTGESYYFDGSWDGPIGGTSLASPIFGAMMTEIDQLQNSRAGLFNATLYKTWLKHGYNSGATTYFRDITQGSNGAYQAGTGYDQVSGIGSMQAANFASLLKKKK